MVVQIPKSDLADKFETWKATPYFRRKAQRTKIEYERHITHFAVWMCQEYTNTDVSQITADHIQHYMDYLQNEHIQFIGHVNREGKGDIKTGLSITSLNIRMRTIKTFWSHLIEKGYSTEKDINNPKKLPMYRQGQGETIKIAKSTDIAKSIEASKTGSRKSVKRINKYVRTRDELIINLLQTSGFRITELLKSIGADLQGNVLRLNAENTKTRKTRRVPIQSKLSDQMITLYKRTWGYPEDTPWEQVDKKNNFFVVESTKKQLTGKAFHKRLALYSELAEVDGIHPHMLRHTFASNAIKEMSLGAVKKILGHASIATTNIYIDLFDDEVFEEFRQANDKKEETK